MKCPKCGGTGEANMSNGMFAWKVECDECCGGGVVAPLTEEEYIQSCDTEQLAEVLNKIFMTRTFCHICPEGGVCDIGYKCKYHGGKVEDFVEWLKQPHTESVTNCNE